MQVMDRDIRENIHERKGLLRDAHPRNNQGMQPWARQDILTPGEPMDKDVEIGRLRRRISNGQLDIRMEMLAQNGEMLGLRSVLNMYLHASPLALS